MADPLDATLAAVTAVFTKISAALDALGKKAEPEKEPEKPTVDLSQATEEAQRARAKYDSLIKWALGVFAGIGALIFGSVPFAGLAHVDMWPWGALGLLVSALGLSLVVWGATRSWEPVDASLGELEVSLKRFRAEPKWYSSLEHKANYRLRQALTREPATHLGPGVTSVRGLIHRIGELEDELLGAGGGSADVRSVVTGSVLRGMTNIDAITDSTRVDLFANLDRSGDAELDEGDRIAARMKRASVLVVQLNPQWDRVGRTPEELEEELFRILSRRRGETRSPIVLAEVASELAARLSASDSVLSKLQTLRKESDGEVKVEIDRAMLAELANINGLVNSLAVAEDARAVGHAKAIKDKLDLYLARRHLLLSESTVVQARWIFQVARAWIALGAILTLGGGIAYVYAITNPVESAGANSLVVASINKTATAAWDALKACQPDDEAATATTGLSAVLTSSDDRDGMQDGPFSIVVAAGPCAGQAVSVGDHEGGYTLAVPGAATSTAPPAAAQESTTTKQAFIEATIDDQTDAWFTVFRECPRLDPAGPFTDLQGALTTADPTAATDGVLDGPFTLQITDKRCDAAFSVDVLKGEGSYTFR